jgi:hypothetical protein
VIDERWRRQAGRFLAAALLLGACLACRGSSETPKSKPSAPHGSATGQQVFAGLHYALQLPTGWSASKTETVWNTGTRPDPYQSGFDTLTTTASVSFIAVGSRPVAAGTTTQAWRQQLNAEGVLGYSDCGPASAWETDLLAHEPALRLPLPCEPAGVDAELLLTVHMTSGWAVICGVPHGATPGPKETCSQWLSTFRFSS